MFLTKSGKRLSVCPLIHASIRIVFDGREIEIDPVAKLGNRTTDYSFLPKADYIFVTHEHLDHFDKEAIQTLTGDSTTIILNRRCADMLGKGIAMDNGEQRTLGSDFTVQAVPAYNTTQGHTQYHPKGRDNGYILSIDGLRIYVAGDTEDIPEMERVGAVDIAFLPCNQPYTMTTEQLANAARMLMPKVLYPYHYSNTDITKVADLLQNENIDVRVRPFD